MSTEPLATVPVPGGHLAYRDTGDGPPVVLLHGGVLDHRMWRHQITALARDHRVIAVDARGHGQSSTPRGPFRHTDDLAALITALGIGPAALVGLSLGAGTAVDTAVEYPDLVTALVVSGTGTSDPDFRDPDLLALFDEWQRAEDPGTWLDVFVRIGVGRRDPADVDPAVLAEIRAIGADTLAAHVPDGSPILPTTVADIRTRQRNLRLPVLAVIGTADFTDHIRLARDLVDTARGSAVEIPGTAHYPNLEQPERFTRALRDFLSRP